MQSAGNHAEALNVFAELIRDFPDSTRARDAKLLWATSAIAAGKAVEVPGFLAAMSEADDADALLLTAKAFEAQGSQSEAIKYYRRTYFRAAGSNAAREAEAKLTGLGQPLNPQTADEQQVRADKFFAAKNYGEAANAYAALAAGFPASMTPQINIRRLTALANTGRMADAQMAFGFLPTTAKEREEGYRQMVIGYAKAKMWPQARSTADEMRQRYPTGTLVAKTFIDAGLAARDAKNRTDEGYFLNTAVAALSKRHRGRPGPIRIRLVSAREQQFCVVVADVHRASCTLRRQGHDKSRQGRILGGPRLRTRRQDPPRHARFTTA